MAIQIIKPKNDEEWLEIKKNTIGGSEIAIICGLNKWMTPYQFWLVKTGREERQEASIVMKRGSYFEDGLVNMWEGETGHRVIKSSAKNILYIDTEYPFLSVTPDRRFFHKDGGKRTIEAKTTFGRYEEPLDAWRLQLYWELMFTGDKFGEIVYEYPDPRVCFMHEEVESNKEIQAQLKEIAIEWWNKHIINDIEPDLSNSSDLLKKFDKEEEGKYIEASTEVQNYYSEIKSIQMQVLPLNKRIDEIKELLKMKMGNTEAIKFDGETLFSWKVDSRGIRIFRIKR